MSSIRQSAVAGRFYPADRGQLMREVMAYLDAVPATADQPVPKALIVPHAGYL